MSTTFNSTNSGSGKAVDADLLENTNTLRSSFSTSGSFPASPVAGQKCFRTDLLACFTYSGAAWVEEACLPKSDVDLQGDGTTFRQLVNNRIENTASDPTPAAGQVGRVVMKTTASAEKLKVVTTSAKLETVWSAAITDFQRVQLDIAPKNFDLTTPPTIAEHGTTNKLSGALFDATTDKIRWTVRVPQGVAGADAKLRLGGLLQASGGETASDTIEWTSKVRCLKPNNNEYADLAAWTTATSSLNIGTNIAEGAVFVQDVPLDFDDTTNPVEAGDYLVIELTRTTVGGAGKVGAVIIFEAEALFPSGIKPTE